MTWLEFMRLYDYSIESDDANFILWNETAFPMGGIRMVSYQTRSAIRAAKNQIRRCWMCGFKFPYHKGYCLRRGGDDRRR